MGRLAFQVFYSLLLNRFKKKVPGRLLLVAEYDEKGGTRTYLINLLYFLKKRGYDVYLMSNGKLNDEEIGSILKKLDFHVLEIGFDFWCIDMKIVPVGIKKKQLIRYQLNEILFWSRLLNKYKFSSFVFSVGYPELFLYSFLLPVRVIYILHTTVLKVADRYKRWILKIRLSSRRQIITVSAFARTSIEKYWLSGKKNKYVSFIYNYYSPKYSNLTDYLKINNKQILTIGAIETYKNPTLFIEVAKSVIKNNPEKKIEFIWAGSGSLINHCRQSVLDYPQIKFLGNVDNVEKLYKGATVYYQPSLLESHGIATIGAMYHKIPCVVSDHGGLKESVVNNHTGFVISVIDKSQSVNKISELLDNENLCATMGLNGYERYLQKFTKEIWQNDMSKKL